MKGAIFALALCLLISTTNCYDVETKFFHQKVDHFGVQVQGRGNAEATFRHKYLVVTEYSDTSEETNDEVLQVSEGKEDVPTLDLRNQTIFFYAGGHGPIEDYFNKSGYVLDLAEYYGALVIYAEHRFYGDSQPFEGSNTTFPDTLSYLNVDQVLADYMNLLFFLKYDYDMPNAKIITFGVNYAGSLAAYLRAKFPNEIAGALASGAPVKMADNFEARTLLWTQVNKAYESAPSGPVAVETIMDMYRTLNELWEYGKMGRKSISQKMNLCTLLASKDEYDILLATIRNVFVQFALHNYPYETNGYPANATEWSASFLNNQATLSTEAVRLLVNEFYGLEPEECLDIFSVFQPCADQTGCAEGLDGELWDFQVCWELDWEIGSDLVDGMFPNLPWTDEDRTAYCNAKFDLPTNQRHQWFGINYWGSEIASVSNIIWTNGQLDPFYGSGIIDTSTPDLAKVGSMENAGHGLDLRAPVEGDGMEEYREIELELIGQIIDGTFPAS